MSLVPLAWGIWELLSLRRERQRDQQRDQQREQQQKQQQRAADVVQATPPAPLTATSRDRAADL